MIRAGIAGLGGMGSHHAQVFSALPSATLVAGADLEPDRRDRFAEKYGAAAYPDYRAMLEQADLDMVLVTLPTYLHAEASIAAARAGRHVLCEKPMALTVADCDAMIAAAKGAGVTLMIAHVLRFWPEYAAVKHVVDSGELGKVLSVSASRVGARPRWSWQGWFTDPKRSGGAVLDLHIHDIDFILWLMGRPGQVHSVGAVPETGGLDTCFTTLSGFPGGGVAFAEASWCSGGVPFSVGLRIDLEGGTLAFPREGRGLLLGRAGKDPEPVELPRPTPPEGMTSEINVSDFGGYFLEDQYFLDCITRGVAPAVTTPGSSRDAVAACLAAEQCARTGTPGEW